MARLRDLEAQAATLNTQPKAETVSPIAFHPAIAKRYAKHVAALAQALHHIDNRAALDAARALIDRVIVHAPETNDDPPGIKVIGQLAELLKAAGLGSSVDKARGAQDNAVLRLFAS